MGHQELGKMRRIYSDVIQEEVDRPPDEMWLEQWRNVDISSYLDPLAEPIPALQRSLTDNHNYLDPMTTTLKYLKTVEHGDPRGLKALVDLQGYLEHNSFLTKFLLPYDKNKLQYLRELYRVAGTIGSTAEMFEPVLEKMKQGDSRLNNSVTQFATLKQALRQLLGNIRTLAPEAVPAGKIDGKLMYKDRLDGKNPLFDTHRMISVTTTPTGERLAGFEQPQVMLRNAILKDYVGMIEDDFGTSARLQTPLSVFNTISRTTEITTNFDVQTSVPDLYTFRVNNISLEDIAKAPIDDALVYTILDYIAGMPKGNVFYQRLTEILFFTTPLEKVNFTIEPNTDFQRRVMFFQQKIAEKLLLPAQQRGRRDEEFDKRLQIVTDQLDYVAADSFKSMPMRAVFMAPFFHLRDNPSLTVEDAIKAIPLTRVMFEENDYSTSYVTPYKLGNDFLIKNSKSIIESVKKFKSNKALREFSKIVGQPTRKEFDQEYVNLLLSSIQHKGVLESARVMTSDLEDIMGLAQKLWENLQEKGYVDYFESIDTEEGTAFPRDQGAISLDTIHFGFHKQKDGKVPFYVTHNTADFTGYIDLRGKISDIHVDLALTGENKVILKRIQGMIGLALTGQVELNLQAGFTEEDLDKIPYYISSTGHKERTQKPKVDSQLSNDRLLQILGEARFAEMPDLQVDVDYIAGEGRKEFMYHYRYATDFQAKKVFALQLAFDERSRFKNIKFLLDRFVPPNSWLEKPLTKDQRAEGQRIRDEMTFLFMEQGLINPNSKEGKEAGQAVLGFIERNEDLKALQGVINPAIFGAIVNAKIFEKLPDKEKKERFRSWTTKAILRRYLGDITVHRPKNGVGFFDLLHKVPDRIFSDPDSITGSIVRNYFSNLALRLFNDGERGGFKKLRDMIQRETNDHYKQFLLQIESECRGIREEPVPSQFITQIASWEGEYLPFPHFRQKYFVHEFMKTKRKLLNGATGSTKTACAFLAMESSGAERVTIFGPAIARRTWANQANKLFKEDQRPDVFTITSMSDLLSTRTQSAKYVYISGELLASAENDPELYSFIHEKLVAERGTDGVIIDEAHAFCNAKAHSSSVITRLVQSVENRNPKKNKSDKVPIVALTATPIVSSLKDMDLIMGVLYPERFSVPKNSDPDRKPTFNETCMHNPHLAYSLLFGENLMIQWTLEDIFGEKTPESHHHTKKIELTHFEKTIYDWVRTLPIGALEKVELMRASLLMPELVKRNIQGKKLQPPEVPLVDLSKRLTQLFGIWKEWDSQRKPEDRYTPFNREWIAQSGDSNFILQCFFHPQLSQDIDDLVKLTFAEDTAERVYYQPERRLPSKFKYILEQIKNHVPRDLPQKPEDDLADEQVMVMVPYHKRGITTYREDLESMDEINDEFWSWYEYLIVEEGYSPEIARRVQGGNEVNFQMREDIAQLWSNHGHIANIIFATMDSIYMSGDWAPRNNEHDMVMKDSKGKDVVIKSNSNIKKAQLYWPHWPFGKDEFDQGNGRLRRPGVAKPIDITVLEANDTIDQGLRDVVKMKDLLIQMALYGIELDEDDQAFFDENRRAKRIIGNENFSSLRFVMTGLKGKGEEKVREFMTRKTDGRLTAEQFAREYFNNGLDEYRIVGNNAKIVARLLENNDRILSLGAGSCLLARTMAKNGINPGKIVNVDMNGIQMSVMRQIYPFLDQTTRVGVASNLRQLYSDTLKRDEELSDGSFDAVESSFMLDWTKHEEDTTLKVEERERVKILSEMNRVLKVGGQAVITLSESSFNNETFITFVQTLRTHFGFQIENNSGHLYATDVHPVRKIGWIISLKKTGVPQIAELNPDNLMLLSDKPIVSTYKGERETTGEITVFHTPQVFSAQEFQIENPLNGELQEINTRDYTPLPSFGVEPSIVEGRPAVNTIIPPEDNPEDTRQRILQRAIQYITRKYNVAEDIVTDAMSRIKLERFATWDHRLIQRYADITAPYYLPRIDSDRLTGKNVDLWRRSVYTLQRELGIDWEVAKWLASSVITYADVEVDTRKGKHANTSLEQHVAKLEQNWDQEKVKKHISEKIHDIKDFEQQYDIIFSRNS